MARLQLTPDVIRAACLDAGNRTLEAALDAIARDNNLTTVDVGRMPVGERIVRTARVHYEGFTRDGIHCSSGYGDTIGAALAEALAKSVENRTPLPFVSMDLPSFEVAA